MSSQDDDLYVQKAIDGLDRPQKIIAGGAVLAIIGAFLPWTSLGQIGFQGDAILILFPNLILVSSVVIYWNRYSKTVAYVVGVFSLLLCSNAIINNSFNGIGLYLIIISELALLYGLYEDVKLLKQKTEIFFASFLSFVFAPIVSLLVSNIIASSLNITTRSYTELGYFISNSPQFSAIDIIVYQYYSGHFVPLDGQDPLDGQSTSGLLLNFPSDLHFAPPIILAILGIVSYKRYANPGSEKLKKSLKITVPRIVAGYGTASAFIYMLSIKEAEAEFYSAYVRVDPLLGILMTVIVYPVVFPCLGIAALWFFDDGYLTA